MTQPTSVRRVQRWIEANEAIPEQRQRIFCEGQELTGRWAIRGVPMLGEQGPDHPHHGMSLPCPKPMDVVEEPQLGSLSTSGNVGGEFAS